MNQGMPYLVQAILLSLSFVNRCFHRKVKVRWPVIIKHDELWKRTNEIKIIEQVTRRNSSKGKCNRGGGYGVEPTGAKEKRKAIEELAENITRKPQLLGRHGEKLNNSARTVWDGDTLSIPYAQWELKDDEDELCLKFQPMY